MSAVEVLDEIREALRRNERDDSAAVTEVQAIIERHGNAPVTLQDEARQLQRDFEAMAVELDRGRDHKAARVYREAATKLRDMLAEVSDADADLHSSLYVVAERLREMSLLSYGAGDSYSCAAGRVYGLARRDRLSISEASCLEGDPLRFGAGHGWWHRDFTVSTKQLRQAVEDLRDKLDFEANSPDWKDGASEVYDLARDEVGSIDLRQSSATVLQQLTEMAERARTASLVRDGSKWGTVPIRSALSRDVLEKLNRVIVRHRSK